MNDMRKPLPPARQKPVVIPVKPFVSREYAEAEGDKLWARVWQAACRLEELPKVGDYVTYDIGEESIIVVRVSPEEVRAMYNVCLHRGRRLTEGCGHTNQFYCRFHGWSWNIDGTNRVTIGPEDWQGALTDESLTMKQVKVGLWGGWVWINMDPDCQPLETFLAPVIRQLGPFETDKMRYAWRQWLYFPCNWKAALGAFSESYHVHASHPQLGRGMGVMAWWCQTEGAHMWHGPMGERGGSGEKMKGLSEARGDVGKDPRVAIAEDLQSMWDTLRGVTTETFVNASKRLKDELPEGASMEQVGHHLLLAAKADDEARGVIWPEVSPEHLAATGIDWHVFPNSVFLPSLTTLLCYRARPNGTDPNSCIFEVYVLERFPEGEEPKTEWVFEADPSEEKWRLILAQDFSNMAAVQKGMKSRGYQGARPNPIEEQTVIHFHRVLAEYMGTGAPVPISKGV